MSYHLSHISPKDAVNGKLNKRMEQALNIELKRADGTANGDTIAFVIATRKCLKVTSGKEAVQVTFFSEFVLLCVCLLMRI